MTLAFPSYRNSFHAAWTLLLVPPLVGLLVNFTNDSSLLDFAVILRVMLAAGLVLPVIWLRLDQVSGRAQRLLKELRMQMPGCLVAIVLPGMLGWANTGEVTEWIIGTFGFGCLLLGAAPFGSEYDQRTLSGLLTQPLARATIFAEKVGVLCVLLVVATANLWLTVQAAPGTGFNSETAVTATLLPLFALCSGPLYSLVSRSTLAGLVFTLTVPMGLTLATMLLLHPLFRFLPLDAPSEQWLGWLLWFVIPGYLLATFVAGWRAFSRLQLRDGGAGGRSATGMHPLSLPIDRFLHRALPAGSATAHLVRKELRLHVVPWLVAGAMVGLWLLVFALKLLTTNEELKNALNDVSVFAVFGGLLGTLALVTGGAACVAEERELGTLEWQVTQPVPLARQWWIKVLVAVGIAASLGFFLPASLLWASFDRTQLVSSFGDIPPVAMLGNVAFFSLLLAISIYASSIARNTMKATAAAAFIAAGLAGLLFACGLTFGAVIDNVISERREQWSAGVNAPAWAPSPEMATILGLVALGASAVGLIGAFLALGGRNFRQMNVRAGAIARQLSGIAVGLVVTVGILGTLFSQLALLVTQADFASAQQGQRTQAINEVRQFANSGLLTPEVARQFGVGENASPEALVDAVIARDGFEALDRLSQQLRLQPAPAAGGAFMMDPLLARRYGLRPGVARTNETATPVQPNPPLQMDPELMKRYGLQPTVPKP